MVVNEAQKMLQFNPPYIWEKALGVWLCLPIFGCLSFYITMKFARIEVDLQLSFKWIFKLLHWITRKIYKFEIHFLWYLLLLQFFHDGIIWALLLSLVSVKVIPPCYPILCYTCTFVPISHVMFSLGNT